MTETNTPQVSAHYVTIDGIVFEPSPNPSHADLRRDTDWIEKVLTLRCLGNLSMPDNHDFTGAVWLCGDANHANHVTQATKTCSYRKSSETAIGTGNRLLDCADISAVQTACIYHMRHAAKRLGTRSVLQRARLHVHRPSCEVAAGRQQQVTTWPSS